MSEKNNPNINKSPRSLALLAWKNFEVAHENDIVTTTNGIESR
jgi:hypothetical protein